MNNEHVAMTTFREFLDENGWRHLTDEDGAFRGLVSGKCGHCHWYAHLNGDGRFLAFRIYCPVNVPVRRRPAVAEYLMRANWGLNFGNFEMDWSDGEVSFRTSVATDGLHPGSDALNHLVYGNHSTMDRYLAGLLAVACGNAVPGKAIVEAEKDLQPPAEPTEQIAKETREHEPNNTPGSGRQPRKFSPNDN